MRQRLRAVDTWARWAIPLVALLSAGLYVALAWQQGRAGFPLDDAWIHQTFARNLARTGQMAYLPGQPSAGSTAPAWSMALSLAYMVGLDYRVWAYVLGAASLAATAWLVYRLALRLAPGRLPAALGAGLFCAVEWHLAWAAGSGMETMLYTALALGLLEYYYSFIAAAHPQEGAAPASVRREQALVGAGGIGLVAGLLVATRPEGAVLAGLVLAGLVAVPRPAGRDELRLRLLSVGIALAAMAVIVGPYVAFNLRTAGSILPNTFYAKQAEYRLALGPAGRLWRVLSPTLVGAQAVLVPGLVYAAYRLIRERRWPALLPLAWWGAILALYAVRLPVDYQHGRYAMPTIPVLILYGVWGTAEWLRPHRGRPWGRVLGRALPAASALLAGVFWVRGAAAYRDDIGFIEGEMVAMAHWLATETAPGQKIAVHDIGAVGYLTDRPLLDLAGLITPDVIPFIADAERLAAWLIERGADYAVFFPDFSPTYAGLAADPRFEPVYCTGYAWTRAAGHANLCAYRVQR